VTDNDPEQHARITRRGQQISQIAQRMELGDEERGRGGAEALLYLADAIARVAATSQDPRLALKTVVSLFDKIDDAWFAKQPKEGPVVVARANQLLSDTAFEIALGHDVSGADPGRVAAIALGILTDAVVNVAALNSQPRQIIGHVVRRLNEVDVDAVRREQLK
jgi:hypothetical protein